MNDNTKITKGTTSTKSENIIEQKISRPKELTLLFWVDEDNSGRNMFKEAAQTRMQNIKNAKSFNDNVQKVHCPLFNLLKKLLLLLKTI